MQDFMSERMVKNKLDLDFQTRRRVYTGCSAGVAHSSGGRVVAGSNPVIPILNLS